MSVSWKREGSSIKRQFQQSLQALVNPNVQTPSLISQAYT
jgi:hypothetical protein